MHNAGAEYRIPPKSALCVQRGSVWCRCSLYRRLQTACYMSPDTTCTCACACAGCRTYGNTVGGGLPGLRGGALWKLRGSSNIRLFQWFLSCAAHSLYIHWEREYTTHTNTTPQHAASQACLLHDGDVLTQGSVCVLLLPPAWSRQ